ncbi:hypothetical protein GA0070624_3405 [Micromonospora rhizosphaerae]|uniref:Dynamin family protein n=1 Tax=Micromonospora rhizosphaerae TaxID=568872 RepID=A0A1C6SBW1_9ACTN|nr:hypothetical protein [Micromonospora rhizosphaerae]SCL26961.1 hypothetical protein GA0070624_3405 [Micromonospora rhizosphaerae]
MSDLEALTSDVRQQLEALEEWLGAEPSLGHDDVHEHRKVDREWLATAMYAVHQLKVRAASALINVAFVGQFSSGKSFLISGLVGMLDYEEVIGDDDMPSEQYLGLLYSAPKHTTACPVTVVPVTAASDVDASGRGFLRVRFTDSREWEAIGNSVPPAVVAAYTTQDPRLDINRLSVDHRSRQVAEVEILLRDCRIPGKLYDLPGHGSIDPQHDQIADRAWHDADCFVFVTQATQTVGREDDELIRRLHDHHVRTGKPVIWVVTGIDRANSTNPGEHSTAWQQTVSANNSYLVERFPPVQRDASPGFIGAEGFIPVSPAWEAYGRWLMEQGDGQRHKGQNYARWSRMGRLRGVLTDLIEAGTGQTHLRGVAEEAHRTLASRLSLLTEMLHTARTPLEEMAGERDRLRLRLEQLNATIPEFRERLREDLLRRIRNMSRTFDGLAEHLHTALDDAIRAADLSKKKESEAIESRRADLLREWTSQHGPEKLWERESQEFLENVFQSVQTILGDTTSAEQMGSASTQIDLTRLKTEPSQRYRTSGQDILQDVSKVLGVGTSIVTAIVAGAGFISGPVVIVPVGLSLAFGVVWGLIKRNKSKLATLDLLRQVLIDNLDEVAKEYVVLFAAEADARGTQILDRAVEILSERGIELERRIDLAEQALRAPDNASRRAIVEQLAPHCEQGEELRGRLAALAAAA